MGYELIISEKPSAAKKIAEALCDTKVIKESNKKVPFYKISHKKKDIIVACAVGHLYGLEEKEKKWAYPTFDIEWQPNTKEGYSKDYLDTLKKLAKDADTFTIACDYDVEGEVIGLNIIRYACKRKDARRMKFSTLTKPDLVKAYDTAAPTLNWGQAFAGETRHYLDFYYGINLSRALTQSIKIAAKRFKLMSIGRVQGPALKIIVDKELDIKAFVPTPYWEVELDGTVRKADITAQHVKGRFEKKEDAEKVLANTKGKNGLVADIAAKQSKIAPPNPFDLTTLQTEAYRCFHINPKETLEIAQELYVNGWISYPRTSSQQLPPEIGYQKILADLSKQPEYTELANALIKRMPLRPNNGQKTDPAHPAIYPTGITPDLEGRRAKVYDLIVRRFLSTFAGEATRETVTMKIDVNAEMFQASGTRTTEKGWFAFYGTLTPYDEEELPHVEKNDAVQVKKIEMLSKETQPPKRYTPASIIKELEKRNLGTKSTRAAIVDNLFKREYVSGEPLKATEFGIHTIETLGKFSEEIIDEALTRNFEEEMDQIREGTKKPELVLSEAKEVLLKILAHFKKNEMEIGKGLSEAHDAAQKTMGHIGKCACGGDLQIKPGKFGKFIACTNYPECKITFALPKFGKALPTKDLCKECNHPMIKIAAGKRTQVICINQSCPSKKLDQASQEEADKIVSGEIEKKCPKCGSNLVLRKSIYGQFYGCSKYPKCRYTEKLQQANGNDGANAQAGEVAEGVDPGEERTCPNCGKKLAMKRGRYGPFFGCTGYPECRYIENMQGKGKVLEAKPAASAAKPKGRAGALATEASSIAVAAKKKNSVAKKKPVASKGKK